MGRIAKWLLIGLGGLLVVLIVFVAAVLVLVDPNDYRDEIAQTVERQTGRQLTIDGELGLTFFPWLGLEAGSMSLADAPGFGSEPFVQVDRVALAVKVLPLLAGEFMLDTVVLDRPQIRLLRNEQGEANWEQLGKGATEPAPAEEPGGGGVPAVLQNASLEGVEINEARLVYEDLQANTSATLDPLNLTLADVRFGAPIGVEGDWQASLENGPSINGELATTVSASKDLTSAAAKDIELNLEAAVDALPGGSQTATIQGQLQANLAKAVYQLTGLTVEAAGAVLEGQAEARLMSDDPVATGRLTVPETSPRDILAQLAIEPPPTRDADVLSRLSAEIEFRFADGQLHLKPLNATLDDSELAGEALIRDFAAPAANFDLRLDEIDVDRYLPPKTEQAETGEDESTPPSSRGGTAGDGAGELPIETLRRLDLKGRMHIDSFKVSGARASDINIGITAKDGRIRVNPLAAALYQGKYSGDLRLDVSGEQPMISVDEQLTGIQVGPLLADVADFDQLLGQGDIKVDATSRGLEPEPLLEALKGEAQFAFTDGTVKGINIAQTLRSAMARVTGGGDGQADAPQETDFSSLTGTLRFDGGVVRNPDLSAKSPLLRVDGEGQANLLKRTLDYLLTVNVVGTLEGQGGRELQQLKGAPVPLRLSGSLTSPGVSVDVQQALQALAGERLEEKETELRKKLKEKQGDVEKKAREKVEEQVQDQLKGLFNN